LLYNLTFVLQKSVGLAKCGDAHLGIPALRKLMQEDQEFKANLSYTGKLCLQKREKKIIHLLSSFIFQVLISL
jgi:hypothetical protein